jgi:tetratricopeptide (TPR) repeat protein
VSPDRTPIRVAIALAALGGALLAGCARTDAADREVAEGVARARAGDVEAALAHFERALRADADHPAALANAGLAALLADRPAAARDHLARLLAASPEDHRSRFLLARAHLALGETEPALAAARRAVADGFDDLAALTDEAFAPLRSDLRFVQALGLAAQHAGRRLPADAGGRLLLGDEPLHTLNLPGAAMCPPPAAAGPRDPDATSPR